MYYQISQVLISIVVKIDFLLSMLTKTNGHLIKQRWAYSGSAMELHFGTIKLRQDIGKSEKTKGRLAFIGFWEKTGEDYLERKFIRGEWDFEIVVDFVTQMLFIYWGLILMIIFFL